MSNAIHKVKETFPNADIGICSILPRKGTGPNNVKCNLTSSFANAFMNKMCTRDSRLSFIDLWHELAPKNIPLKSMYDPNDPTGIHISKEGAIKICDVFTDFVKTERWGEYQTPFSRKRNRSNASTPGSAEKQAPKIQKAL